MTHAVVLIEAERDALPTLGGELADLDGVAEAYSVTGEWDFVAIVRVRDTSSSPRSMTGELVKLDRASCAPRRWSPSRSSPSTTSRRCSRSASERRPGGRARPPAGGGGGTARQGRWIVRRAIADLPGGPRGPRAGGPAGDAATDASRAARGRSLRRPIPPARRAPRVPSPREEVGRQHGSPRTREGGQSPTAVACIGETRDQVVAYVARPRPIPQSPSAGVRICKRAAGIDWPASQS